MLLLLLRMIQDAQTLPSQHDESRLDTALRKLGEVTDEFIVNGVYATMLATSSQGLHLPRFSVLVRSRSHSCPHQKRSFISNYFSDVLRTGSLSPSNPVLETLDTIYPEKNATDTTEQKNLRDFRTKIPKFSAWRPHHLKVAAEHLKSRHEKDIEDLREKLESTGKAPQFLKDVVVEWDQVHAPSKFVHNAAFVMALLSDPSLHRDFKKALSELSMALPNAMNEATLEQYPDTDLLALFQSKLEQHLKHLKEDKKTSTKDEDWLWAANYWERVIRHRTGLGLKGDDREKFRQNLEAIEILEGRMFQNSSDPTKDRLTEVLSDGYSIIDLRRQNSQLLGYNNFAEQVFETRMANSVQEVQQLHEDIAEIFLPVVQEIKADPFRDNFFKPGEIYNPTFDGALEAISGLVMELFGVEIRVEGSRKARELAVWNKDVWLLHVMDHVDKNEDGEARYLGNIFLDPFKRPAKLKRSFLAPLADRGVDSEPLVAISLEITPPVWDDMDAEISWEDTESMIHEFGHAIQLILAKSSIGGVCGGHNLPLDVSEVMPQFMEHWVFEESMMNGVMKCSGRNHTLTSEMIEKLQSRRKYRKSKMIMQNVFFGSFELELFSTFDPRGDESLVGVQRRVANQYIPHDIPDKKDLSPFLDVMAENARGAHIAFYRYLWSEIYSAGLYQAFPHGLSSSSSDRRRQGINLRRSFFDQGATLDPREVLTFSDEAHGKPVGALLDTLKIPR